MATFATISVHWRHVDSSEYKCRANKSHTYCRDIRTPRLIGRPIQGTSKSNIKNAARRAAAAYGLRTEIIYTAVKRHGKSHLLRASGADRA